MGIVAIKKSITIDYSANATTASVEASGVKNGLLKGIVVVAPNLASTHSYTFSITDNYSSTVFSRASLVENTTTTIFTDSNNFPLDTPFAGPLTLKVVTSGDETADVTFTVIVYVLI